MAKRTPTAPGTQAPTLHALHAQLAGTPAPLTLPSGLVKVRSARRITLAAPGTRDAQGGTPAIDIADDELVRVDLGDGLVIWSRADDLLREHGEPVAERSSGGSLWTLQAASQGARLMQADATQADRGVVGLGIQALEFFGVDVAPGAARKIGAAVDTQRLEGRTEGLYRVNLDTGALTPVKPPLSAASRMQPIVVFIHGTLSNFQGSFGGLVAACDPSGAAAGTRAALKARFGEHIYAFEHATLGVSPVANATGLCRWLQGHSRVHLVSHSRGGLVGELMCLAERERTPDPLDTGLVDLLFGRDEGPAFRELLKALDRSAPRIERFVRVACPARGTTLASGRLDRWLSMLQLLSPIPLLGDALDFMLAVVKERTDPHSLPGLAAMLPDSALTRLLQHPSLRTRADLSVIAGDAQGRGVWGRAKMLVADWFFSADHDLVVNTGSMLGGLARPPGGARYRRDAGELVTHFNYFRNRSTLQWLVDGLTRPDGQDAGFLPLPTGGESRSSRVRAALRSGTSASGPRPLAVVIPGTMGSGLDAGDQGIWLHYLALLKGGMGDITIDAPDVRATELLNDFYGPLIEHLSRTHRVEVFPYDWRRSVRDAAADLATHLAQWLPEQERQGQPVHLVAHSMGGLVCRAMIADQGPGADVWRRITALPRSRLLMLGTPNLGSHEAVRWLVGQNPTQAKLILLDFTRGAHGVIDVVRRFPGLAELLPFADDPSPWGQLATWKRLKSALGAGWPLTDDTTLQQARDTWARLRRAPIDTAHMVYVAGCQPATVVDHAVVDPGEGPQLVWQATAEGDGTVAWSSKVVPDSHTWYAPDTAHDELCANEDDRRIFRGYCDLLFTGATDQLPQQPPGQRRRSADAPPATFTLPPLPAADAIPGPDELRGAGLGGLRQRRRAQRQTGSPLTVSVRHGDLRYACHPVLVGHYMGDAIVSAEAVIDQRLAGSERQGPLSRRRDLGLYPGPHGTHAVFFNEHPGHQPTGALVIGLDQVGSLTPGRLEAATCDVLLHYALQSLQRDCDRTQRGERLSLGVSALLIGSGVGGFRVRDSVEAVVRGALAANRKLEEARQDHRVILQALEFVELYEDIAIDAARELASLVDAPDLTGRLHWPERVVIDGEGRHVRSRFQSDPSWWQRIEITEDTERQSLHFVEISTRARAEASQAHGQLALIDPFIAQAVGTAQAQPDLSKTLFELLLPQRMKDSTPDQRDVVLLLDETSARFPWELIEDRWGRRQQPLSIAGGMVRQLKTHQFRSQPQMAATDTAYVVGDPDLGGWERFCELPGARMEAERVHQRLSQSGFQAHEAIGTPFAPILDGLHRQPWRVLHLAGHGEHDFELADKRTVSGMVIGRDMLLTPGDIEQLRFVPELVFINCCHLGQTGRGTHQHHRLAANLGVAFIRMGVRAVVCAGWAVDDAAATTFADTFYEQMLAGLTFGEAVKAARLRTWQQFPGSNTWGAYQCYGDPGYRLVRDRHPAGGGRPRPYLAVQELLTDLRNLAESVRMRSKESTHDDDALQRDVGQRVDALLARAPAQGADGQAPWADRADVAAAVGFALGEALLFEQAIAWFDRALTAPQGDCPVRVAEQCANFRVRQAVEAWRRLLAMPRPQGKKAQAARDAERQALTADIRTAITEFDALLNRAPTQERHLLLGGAHRRLAWIESGPARIESLRHMVAHYRQAFDLGGAKTAYAFSNWAASHQLLASLDPAWARHPQIQAHTQELPALLQAQIAQLQRACDADPDFWKACGVADLLVAQLLASARTPRLCPELGRQAADRYAAAMARGASPRERASVEDHIDFVLEMATDPTHTWAPAVIDALRHIRTAF